MGDVNDAFHTMVAPRCFVGRSCAIGDSLCCPCRVVSLCLPGTRSHPFDKLRASSFGKLRTGPFATRLYQAHTVKSEICPHLRRARALP
jgi:hypothetical protein